MTECVPGCGRCCDPVVTSFNPDGEMNGPSADFVREHWHAVDHQVTAEGEKWLSRCDRFDAETRLCLAHEGRPPICSGYPWYGGGRAAKHPLDPGCSFNEDVPGLLLPLFVVNESVTKGGSACPRPHLATYSPSGDVTPGYNPRDVP